MPIIRELKKEDEKELVALYRQMTDKPIHVEANGLDLIVENDSCFSVVLEEDGRVIGTATLSIHLTPVSGYLGKVEDVVVHADYRGQGLGTLLMEELIREAKKRNLRQISLTSRPQREAARKLYEKMGFFLKDTGYFVLPLE